MTKPPQFLDSSGAVWGGGFVPPYGPISITTGPFRDRRPRVRNATLLMPFLPEFIASHRPGIPCIGNCSRWVQRDYGMHGILRLAPKWAELVTRGLHELDPQMPPERRMWVRMRTRRLF